MKTIIITIAALTALTFTSCSKSQEDKIVEFAKSTMKDPKSFELIKLEKKDTVRKSNMLANEYYSDSSMCDYCIEQANEAVEDANRFYYTSHIYVESAKMWHKKGREYLKTMDSCKKIYKSIVHTPKDSMLYETYYLSCYANNTFGKKMIGEYTINIYPSGRMTMDRMEGKEKDTYSSVDDED